MGLERIPSSELPAAALPTGTDAVTAPTARLRVTGCMPEGIGKGEQQQL